MSAYILFKIETFHLWILGFMSIYSKGVLLDDPTVWIFSRRWYNSEVEKEICVFTSSVNSISRESWTTQVVCTKKLADYIKKLQASSWKTPMIHSFLVDIF